MSVWSVLEWIGAEPAFEELPAWRLFQLTMAQQSTCSWNGLEDRLREILSSLFENLTQEWFKCVWDKVIHEVWTRWLGRWNLELTWGLILCRCPQLLCSLDMSFCQKFPFNATSRPFTRQKESQQCLLTSVIRSIREANDWPVLILWSVEVLLINVHTVHV